MTINDDGVAEYTPEVDFCGTDVCCYDLSDGAGGTDSASVTVTHTTTLQQQ